MHITINPTAEPNFSYIGIGTNIGTPEKKLAHIRLSLNLLTEASHTHLIKISSLYESQPWGVMNQPPFYNLVGLIETKLCPADLLIFLKEIEKKTGRTETFRWGPRIIDLDILLYGSKVVQTENLKIPHPYLLERDFVMLPLLEIDPNASLPSGELIKHKAAYDYSRESTLVNLGEIKRK